ncbi:MAG TPA: response regulator transcription factor, partial [Tissierellaceae bacterium]|nr:response regulator transcription factor [Tissierellaceae bacterium]
MAKTRILVVDDEKNITELIRMNLEAEGYEIDLAYTGMEAIIKTDSFKPDLILLDLMLPDIDGLQVCQMIRLNEKTQNIPIIMISARSEESNKVEGLSVGADDYITKPFGLKELEARIRTVLRRVDGIFDDSRMSIDTNIVKYRDMVMDINKYQLRKENTLIDMTPTEFKIMKL